MRKKDFLLIGGLLFLGITAFVFQHIWKENGTKVRVSKNGKTYGMYSLKEDQEISVGEGNRIMIQGGEVWMEWADCPDKLCVHQGAISHTGEIIVCLPNKVTVQVEGENAPELDDVAG